MEKSGTISNIQASCLGFRMLKIRLNTETEVTTETKTELRSEYFGGICGFPRRTGLQNCLGYNACEKLALP